MLADQGAITEPGSAEDVTAQGDTSVPRVPISPAVTAERAKRNTVPKPAMQQGPERIRYQRVHVVSDGETLSEISYDYYGSAGKWRRIFEANRKTIKDANVVMPGTKLVIPN
jgi:nucleoid-associated protein YgaU